MKPITCTVLKSCEKYRCRDGKLILQMLLNINNRCVVEMHVPVETSYYIEQTKQDVVDAFSMMDSFSDIMKLFDLEWVHVVTMYSMNKYAKYGIDWISRVFNTCSPRLDCYCSNPYRVERYF